MTGNEHALESLGMALGTASARLRKSIMFVMAQCLGLNVCFQCGEAIEDVDEFSIEHKVPWRGNKNAYELFFSIENVAFSHLRCNSSAARNMNFKNPAPHGNYNRYKGSGCRCDECRSAAVEYQRGWRARKKSGQ